MNAVTLLAAVSAVAMYVIGAYIRHTRTAEALGTIKSLAQQAAAYYEQSDSSQPTGTAPEAARAMRHFPASSTVSVPELALVRRQRFQSNPADWARAPWSDLHFSIPQPQSYAYSFIAEGSGKDAHASAIAEGDLNGDGVNSSYRLDVIVDGNFHAAPAATPSIREE